MVLASGSSEHGFRLGMLTLHLLIAALWQAINSGQTATVAQLPFSMLR